MECASGHGVRPGPTNRSHLRLGSLADPRADLLIVPRSLHFHHHHPPFRRRPSHRPWPSTTISNISDKRRLKVMTSSWSVNTSLLSTIGSAYTPTYLSQTLPKNMSASDKALFDRSLEARSSSELAKAALLWEDYFLPKYPSAFFLIRVGDVHTTLGSPTTALPLYIKAKDKLKLIKSVTKDEDFLSYLEEFHDKVDKWVTEQGECVSPVPPRSRVLLSHKSNSLSRIQLKWSNVRHSTKSGDRPANVVFPPTYMPHQQQQKTSVSACIHPTYGENSPTYSSSRRTRSTGLYSSLVLPHKTFSTVVFSRETSSQHMRVGCWTRT